MSTRSIPIKLVLGYPRIVLAGHTYVLTVNLEHSAPPDEWPYEKEEYPLTCLLESLPHFEHKSQGDSTLVIHRFGGTYGEIRFTLRARERVGEARLRLLFINGAGLPVHAAEVSGILISNDQADSANLSSFRGLQKHPAVSPTAAPKTRSIRSSAPKEPMADATASTYTPDLEICIRLKDSSLLFEVHAPEAGIYRAQFISEPLNLRPEIGHILRHIHDLPLDTDKDRATVVHRILAKGAEIWHLLPPTVQELLLKHQNGAQSLLIQSEESWIPWEIALLQTRESNGRTMMDGPLLCEAFAVTRWMPGIRLKTRLEIGSLALLPPVGTEPPNVAKELDKIHALAQTYNRDVLKIRPDFMHILDAFASGLSGALHLAGHALSLHDDPNSWAIQLDGPVQLRPDAIRTVANLGASQPLVFFNGWATNPRKLTLTGLGAWPQVFLEANASAFIGTYWAVTDRMACDFAVDFYRRLFEGLPIGEAFRQARQELRMRYPGDPTWLAYTIFAHPLATCAPAETVAEKPINDQETAQRVSPASRPDTAVAAIRPSGIDSRGRHLTPLSYPEHVVESLTQGGGQPYPEWVARWTAQHSVDDPGRKPILEAVRPWDLAETGWAVIFAPDLSPRVRPALAELLEHRRFQADQGRSHYYRELTYNGESTFAFLKKHGGRPGMVADPELFPYYVLLVGSPKSLPYSFQAELDVNHAIGRIYFPESDDYAAYAASVVRSETRPRRLSREVAFFSTEHPGDPSTHSLTKFLAQPLAQSIIEPGMPWQIRKVLGEQARKETLRAMLGGDETPALLFTACHGLSLEFDDDRQEELQGSLVCQDWPGPDSEEGVDADQWFAASDIPEKNSLNGLIAFLYSSYSLGAPARDDFDQISLGRARLISPCPLVARLPQKLLGQRDGALAVIGFVSQAWETATSEFPGGELYGAILYGLRRLLQGHTVGWAMEYLNQSAAALAVMMQSLQDNRQQGEDVDEELFNQLFLLRNNARNLMVFGDPAVRLPGVGEPR